MNTTANPTPSRVDWLFSKMHAFYGERFERMWATAELQAVKREWAGAIAHMSRDDLQRGCVALLGAKYPPTLPEFLAMCAPPPPTPVAHQFRIEHDAGRTGSDEARKRLADIGQQIRVSLGKPDILWARKIVEEAKVKFVPAVKLAFAKEAIRNFEIMHPTHEREPGEDDEDLQGEAA